MKLSTPSALVALLGASVSGSELSTRAANCNPESISAGRDGSLEQLNLATHEACAEWFKNNNNNPTTFNSVPFKLSITGAVGTTNVVGCVSAFATIINDCLTDDILGGSTASQGIVYKIYGAETDSDLRSELVARGSVKKPTNHKSKPAAAKNHPAAVPKKPTAADDAATKKKAAAEKAAAEKKAPVDQQKHPACKNKKVTQAGKAGTKGKPAPAKKPAHGTLRVRALLLDLIKRTKTQFSGRKSFVFGTDAFLISDPYPSQSDLSDKVTLYGFSTKDELKTLFGAREDLDTDEVAAQDVEHILEWQNVGEFLLGQYKSEIENILPSDLKEYKNEDKCQVEFEITINGSKKKGTFSQMVAAAYPATTHFVNEFVLLDKRPNSQVKLNVMRNMEPIGSGTWKGSKEVLLLKLRDVLTVGLYLVNDKVQGFFSEEVKRMGKAFDQLETEMKKKRIITKEKGLDKEWLKYMDGVWDDAKTQLADFMDNKVKELKTKVGCTFDVNIKGTGKVSTPDPDDAPAKVKDDKCKALEFIHDNWVKYVKGKMDTRPWASAGDKRPALSTPQGSKSDLHDDKKDG
ncbi:hypothetical protein N0V94_008562 [Neodidymelliopsis sp. IMI 364377]|nr:hypothetical protein N0V94_008562 [Neodidymelliopsis sp. IMI 364377]